MDLDREADSLALYCLRRFSAPVLCVVLVSDGSDDREQVWCLALPSWLGDPLWDSTTEPLDLLVALVISDDVAELRLRLESLADLSNFERELAPFFSSIASIACRWCLIPMALCFAGEMALATVTCFRRLLK